MIDIRGLKKRFGDREILKGISLKVEKGEVAAIIGPSGGGKSSLLRCLTGLETMDEGTIQIGEYSLTKDSFRDQKKLRAIRQKVGMVFQQFHLFPHLNVTENLIEAPITVLGEARESATERALALLRSMGLSKHERAMPRTLSGGEQQRVAIARALLMKPEVMLFDEPTSALDPVMANEVLGVMTSLAEDGQTMMVVTHSMSFAKKAATHVHVFSDGLIIESGKPEKVFGAPEHAATKLFLRDVER